MQCLTKGTLKVGCGSLKKYPSHPIPPQQRVELSPPTKNVLKIHRKCQVLCFISANIIRIYVNAQCRSWQATRCTYWSLELSVCSPVRPVFRHKWLDLHDACSTTRRLAGDEKGAISGYDTIFGSLQHIWILSYCPRKKSTKKFKASDRHPTQGKREEISRNIVPQGT